MLRFVCFALLLISLVGCVRHKGRVVLLNSSARPIEQALIEVCHQELRLGSIPPGARAEGEFQVTGDSSYSVNVKFSDGKTLQAELGYVTNGMDYQDEIRVQENRILLMGEK